ncbi:cAMP-specific phosphodiesterase Cgs2 [Schizosaccharomyces cryophilus OY26]|uniref:cAMP-specific phosphodiesterase Cgs2 n=1 Tax=Schizosaccharomyces cryophilus (strain OY26 / ATCC MYA-4695 / CBS 11777 / NBRC 106824 / NRRL Y48691) TaxID=653667 RepID=S9VYS5_SCHCR|nr:cAMP-specific phosphodiesterase Cgs2 [Schizosaccharomyces cryophilus OY26]EPY51359.1 cAMP-specific phosphodiesterase Cgs2 [Schizosaccharomyces cryophilus OY26]
MHPTSGGKAERPPKKRYSETSQESFTFFSLGTNGGPLESDCSAHLLSDGRFQEIISIDGGGHLSALAELIERKQLTVDVEERDSQVATKGISQDNVYAKAWLFSEQRIKTFLISHCHFDHIYGCVINSAMFGPQNPRTIVGLDYVINTLKKHVFNNQVWPALDKAGFINFKIIDETMYTNITSSLSILPFPVNHGSSFGHELKSSAFFIRNGLTDRYFLAFGDVEPDKVASDPLNIYIWKMCANLIAKKKLTHILIECSTPDIPDPLLFGHFCPRHLVEELCSLQSLVIGLGGNMDNITVLITHLKSHPLQTIDPAAVIMEQLEALSKQFSLSVTFKIVQRGQFYRFS